MSWQLFLALFFGLPILAMAFAPRMFRRFCLVLCLPLVTLTFLFPARGADNPMIVVAAVPLAFLVAAILVETVVAVRKLAGRRLANG